MIDILKLAEEMQPHVDAKADIIYSQWMKALDKVAGARPIKFLAGQEAIRLPFDLKEGGGDNWEDPPLSLQKEKELVVTAKEAKEKCGEYWKERGGGKVLEEVLLGVRHRTECGEYCYRYEKWVPAPHMLYEIKEEGHAWWVTEGSKVREWVIEELEKLGYVVEVGKFEKRYLLCYVEGVEWDITVRWD